MRLIYNIKTKVIEGVIAERVTGHFPPSRINDNTRYIDIDYSYKTLEKKHPLAQKLEKEKEKLIGKVIEINGKDVTFRDRDL